jgi:hypothetical protein
MHGLNLVARKVLLETLKQPHGCSMRVSTALECSGEVIQINTPLIWLDTNLCIQKPSCALLKDEMTSCCTILLDILCAELLD